MSNLNNEHEDDNIFRRLKAGEPVPMDDPEFSKINEQVNRTIELSVQLNASHGINEVRKHLEEIIGTTIDESTTIFPPFHTNYGKYIQLGRNIFINHGCSFLDLGGIIIEDDVMVGPGVSIMSENHPVEIDKRKTLIPDEVVIKQNAWIGGGATILPGITIGKNSVVGAGAVVTKDVPKNTVAAGMPAKVVKNI